MENLLDMTKDKPEIVESSGQFNINAQGRCGLNHGSRNFLSQPIAHKNTDSPLMPCKSSLQILMV